MKPFFWAKIMHYYKRHIGDYAKKAGHLSPLEHGVYNLIIDSYYDREQAPTLLEATRWARARTEEEKAAVLAVLEEFFTLDEGRYCQKRIDEELASYHEKADTNRAIALQREEQKRARKVNVSSTNREPKEHDSCTTGQPNHKPLTTNQEPLTNKKQKPEASNDFEKAWSFYPKRPGASKADALKAWMARVREGVLPEDMIAGIHRYAEYIRKSSTDPTYIKQPATFFGPGKHYEADWAFAGKPNGPAQNDKFMVAHLDHSSSRAAMEQSMKRHNIVVPEDGDIPF